jgi:hypothetical protein
MVLASTSNSSTVLVPEVVMYMLVAIPLRPIIRIIIVVGLIKLQTDAWAHPRRLTELKRCKG